MPTSFMIWWLLMFISAGLIVGTAVKMHAYNIRGGLLLLSPIFVIFAFLIIPIGTIVVMTAKPSVLRGRTTEEAIQKFETKNIIKRFFYGICIAVFMYQEAHFLVGVLCYMFKLLIEHKVATPESKEKINESFALLFSRKTPGLKFAV